MSGDNDLTLPSGRAEGWLSSKDGRGDNDLTLPSGVSKHLTTGEDCTGDNDLSLRIGVPGREDGTGVACAT